MRRVTFRVHFPGGHDRLDLADLCALQARGQVTAWIGVDGQPRIRFAPPFNDFVLSGGETVTVEKAAAIVAALKHFEIVASVQTEGSHA